MINTTSNPDTRDAHVQVLTAEVRTLVVASRQVTMSVYNQLDDVPPSQIEPFGRVSPKDALLRHTYVVGRDAATGALVRSYVPQHPGRLDRSGYMDFAGGRKHYRHWASTQGELPTDMAQQRRQQLAEAANQWSALPLIVLAGLR